MAAENVWPKVPGDTWFSSDANNSGGIITVEAGENITAGNVVYVHLTLGTAFVSDTGTADDIRATGIAQNTALSGNDVTIMTSGVFVTTGLTDKEDVYLGAAGALSTTRSGVRIGTALSTTELFIDIRQDDRDTIGIIKAWDKDFTGIPSNELSAFWVECDGSVLSDTESPLDGQTLPDLQFSDTSNNIQNRFLRGAPSSGGTGGSTVHGHTLTQVGNVIEGGTGVQDTNLNTTQTDTRPPFYNVVWIMKIK